MPEPPTDPGDQSTKAIKRLEAYAWGAVRNSERSYGPIRDAEDVVQQIITEWIAEVGNKPEAYDRLRQPDSEESFLLQMLIRRVLNSTRYERRTYTRRFEQLGETTDRRRWLLVRLIDLQLDLESALREMPPELQKVIVMRKEERTFEEIGAEMNISRQAAHRLHEQAIEMLQARLASHDQGAE